MSKLHLVIPILKKTEKLMRKYIPVELNIHRLVELDLLEVCILEVEAVEDKVVVLQIHLILLELDMVEVYLGQTYSKLLVFKLFFKAGIVFKFSLLPKGE